MERLDAEDPNAGKALTEEQKNALAEIDSKGPFQISGDPKIMSAMSALFEKFVAQKRLKLPIENRRPCFEVVT